MLFSCRIVNSSIRFVCSFCFLLGCIFHRILYFLVFCHFLSSQIPLSSNLPLLANRILMSIFLCLIFIIIFGFNNFQFLSSILFLIFFYLSIFKNLNCFLQYYLLIKILIQVIFPKFWSQRAFCLLLILLRLSWNDQVIHQLFVKVHFKTINVHLFFLKLCLIFFFHYQL